LRDAESALDQLISFRGKKIEERDVLSVFGLLSREAREGLATAILTSDVPRIIRHVAEMDRTGKDMSRVVPELLEHFRNILVMHYAGKDAAALELPEARIKDYEKQAAHVDPARILRIMDILVETDSRLRHALSKRTLLETGLIHCARAAKTATIDQLLRQIAELKKNFKVNDTSPSGAASEPPASSATLPEAEKKKSSEDELKLLWQNWPEIIRLVGRMAGVGQRFYSDTVPLNIETSHVTIGCDAEFYGEGKSFEAPRTKNAFNRVIERYLDRPVEVSFRLLEPDEKVRLPTDIPVKTPDRREGSEQPEDMKSMYENPKVRIVLEAFNGVIMDIRN